MIKSGILEKELCSHGDSVMADFAFTLKIDLKELNAFFSGWESTVNSNRSKRKPSYRILGKTQTGPDF